MFLVTSDITVTIVGLTLVQILESIKQKEKYVSICMAKHQGNYQYPTLVKLQLIFAALSNVRQLIYFIIIWPL